MRHCGRAAAPFLPRWRIEKVMRRTRFAISFAALLALSACDFFGGAQEEEAGDASGEVLPASVSDGMIPTQDLKSQPPVLREQSGAGGAGGAESADSAAADSAVAGEATPAEEAAPVAAAAE